MKCVKKGKTVIRVSNKRAEELVATGKYQYASKQAWKEGGRKR